MRLVVHSLDSEKGRILWCRFNEFFFDLIAAISRLNLKILWRNLRIRETPSITYNLTTPRLGYANYQKRSRPPVRLAPVNSGRRSLVTHTKLIMKGPRLAVCVLKQTGSEAHISRSRAPSAHRADRNFDRRKARYLSTTNGDSKDMCYLRPPPLMRRSAPPGFDVLIKSNIRPSVHPSVYQMLSDADRVNPVN